MNPVPRSTEAGWSAFDGGATLGQQGSEEGVIVQDDEHRLGARITLERDGGAAPFAICGLFVHTAFASEEPEALQKYAAMKERLARIISSEESDASSQLQDFIEAF